MHFIKVTRTLLQTSNFSQPRNQVIAILSESIHKVDFIWISHHGRFSDPTNSISQIKGCSLKSLSMQCHNLTLRIENSNMLSSSNSVQINLADFYPFEILQNMKYLFKLSFFFLFCSCTVTSHRSNTINLGKPFDLQNLNQTSKGPILFQKTVAADWAVERSGLINLKDPKASVLKSGDEPIQIYFYVLDHPQFGRYAIDTGISKVFRKDSKEWPVSWLVVFGMNTKTLKIRETTDEWLNKNPKKVEGIFLTHMHLDHILGSPDFQPNVPIYVGPKETTGKKFLNLFVQGSTDRVLGENPTLYELNFQEGQKDSPVRILDFFGDQSLLIFHVEGHTKGSLAFLVQSTSGYQLVLGDSCHTSWGWKNNVTPGDFTENQEKNRESLDFLKDLVSKFPEIQVHPGHQSIIVNSN